MKLSEYFRIHGYYAKGRYTVKDFVGSIYGRDSQGERVALTRTTVGIDFNRLDPKMKKILLDSEVLEADCGIVTNFTLDCVVDSVTVKDAIVVKTTDGELITSEDERDTHGLPVSNKLRR